MIVYPAIDIRGGRCVRLVEGDFARETVFDADPAEAARRWAAAGAEWLHVVDLDGAVVGEPVNVEAVVRIRQAVEVPIQLGGGLRLEEHLAAAFDLGVDRVNLGTAALRDPELVDCAVARWGDRVAVGPGRPRRPARRRGLAGADGGERTVGRSAPAGGGGAPLRLHRHSPRRHAGRTESGGVARARRLL